MADYQYLELLNKILNCGDSHDDRTGTGTISLRGANMRFNLGAGFPLLTTKKLAFRWIAEELFWMLSGSTNEKDLRAKGVDIWKEWATKEQCARFGREEGDLGPVYGHQWRNFGATLGPPGSGPAYTRKYADNGFDQIAHVIDMIQKSPNSRRIILTGWNPADADQVALPPCHTLTQFFVRDGKLSAQLYQRSADVFLGVPYNIASYALLTHLLAHVTGLKVGEFMHVFGDVHIYKNHLEQVKEQLTRKPRELPTLAIKDLRPLLPRGTALDLLLATQFSDLKLEGYDPHPKIKAEVSV